MVTAYRTLPAPISEELRERIAQAQVITFASASAVNNYVAAVGRDQTPELVVAIGPITAQAVRDAGLELGAESSEHTIAGLVQSTCDLVGLRAKSAQGPGSAIVQTDPLS